MSSRRSLERSTGRSPRGAGRRFVARFTTLHVALALSLAVHAVVIGWRWADPSGFDRWLKTTPLQVILVNARSAEAPTQAQALAQSSLAGGGDLAEGRATSPLPAAPQAQMGNAPDDARRRVDQLRQEQQQLLAQVRREMALLPPPDPQRDLGTPQERDQEDRRRQLLKLLAEIEKRVNDDNAQPRKRYVSPATREAAYALYYDRLRRRIEDRGTRDFPQAHGRKLYGELTMNITVDATGRLLEADVVRASGNPLLDRRAVAIVRNAAPFARFNTEMRAQTDQIVVTSRFRFTRDDGLEATMLPNQAEAAPAPGTASTAATAGNAQSRPP
jgi:protein TonB